MYSVLREEMVLISSFIYRSFLTCELLRSTLLTQRLEGQRGEQDEKNRNQILESDHSQVAEDTSHLENGAFSRDFQQSPDRKLLRRFEKRDFRPTFLWMSIAAMRPASLFICSTHF